MFTKLLIWLTGFGHSLWAFLEPIVISETGALLNKLLPIALGIVTEIAKTGDLPNAKRDAAFTQLQSAAVAAGIDAGNSVLNAAIELAYQHFQATQSPATAPVGHN